MAEKKKEEEYKPPHLFNLGDEKKYKDFMDHKDAKDAEEEEKLEDEYGDLPKAEIPYKEKEKGKNFYLKQDYVNAEKAYSKALLAFNIFVKDNSLNEAQMSEFIPNLVVPCNINLAIIKYKMSDFMQALFFANTASTTDPTNVKAFYWKAMSNIKMQNFAEALKDLNLASQLDKENKDVIQAYQILKDQKQKFKEKEKKMHQKIIGQMEYSDKLNTNSSNSKENGENIKENTKKNGISQFFLGKLSSLFYYSKLSVLLPLNFATQLFCKRKIPSQFFKKNK